MLPLTSHPFRALPSRPQVQPIFKQFPLTCNVTNKLYRGWDTKIVAYRVRQLFQGWGCASEWWWVRGGRVAGMLRVGHREGGVPGAERHEAMRRLCSLQRSCNALCCWVLVLPVTNPAFHGRVCHF